MDFKKDYINYVLYTIIQNEFYGARDDVRIRKVLEKIILIPDVAKATFLAGKTAGLEILFKYLLYISDKIDKSQITVFNLKDNFEYDLHNLKKICEEIKNYRSEIHKPEPQEEKSEKEAEKPEAEKPEAEKLELEKQETEEDIISGETIPEESGESEKLIEENIAEESNFEEESAEIEEEQGFTLIENKESENSDDEVFGLAGITRSVEMDEEAEKVSASEENETVEQETEQQETEQQETEQQETEQQETKQQEINETIPEIETESIKENEFIEQPFEEVFEAEDEEILTASDVEKINRIKEKEEKEKGEELEIEIKNSAKDEDERAEDGKEGSVTSDVYYRFENKFFEEVKILEKLFSNIEKACRDKSLAKLSEKSLQSFSEIIEISSELGDLTRQLSLDLTADIFLTINLLFTRAINNPSLINPERTKLLNSSLLLVTSLIKGEDYLGYDELVKKIESLKEELKKPADSPKKEIIKETPRSEKTKTEDIPAVSVKDSEPEPKAAEPKAAEPKDVEMKGVKPKDAEPKVKEQKTARPKTANQTDVPEKETKQTVEYPKEIIEKPAAISSETESRNMDTALFKMKYLVKEFEKNFNKVISTEGEYSKFEILDEIDNLNNLLKMLARTSSSVKNTDVLKLSEVSYVFLKYLKDYRMNLLDTEIQQIIKYIIFTFKMLLTDRKPEDFDVLVQYLNNPVKIFTDS